MTLNFTYRKGQFFLVGDNCLTLKDFILFYFVLFCFVLFCFVLFCFVLFCFVLSFRRKNVVVLREGRYLLRLEWFNNRKQFILKESGRVLFY